MPIYSIDMRNQAMIKSKGNGFTLIELLVVISIISLLSSITLSSLSSARSKSQDAARNSEIRQIAAAIELYYHDNGYYPKLVARGIYTGGSTCGGTLGNGDPQALAVNNWCTLESLLSPYLSASTTQSAPSSSYAYFYRSSSGDNFQTFGLSGPATTAQFLQNAANDGGVYANRIEYGSRPAYCRGKYPIADAGWEFFGSSDNGKVCTGGN